jgi:hypothetical protein
MLKHAFSFIIFCLATCYITFPLLVNIGEYTTGTGDQLVNAWIQNWVIHAVSTGNIISIFNANLYYPYQNSLAFSDTFFTSSLIAVIPHMIIGQPIVVDNVTLILSLVFLGFSIYMLTFYLTRDFMASLLSGILVIFSPAYLSNIYQLQMIAIVGVPLSLLFILLFFNTQKSFYLGLSLTVFILQFYNSFLPAYFIALSYIIILFCYWLKKKKLVKTLFNKINILLIIITVLLMIPIVIPYYQVSKEFHYVRDVRDAIHFAIQPEDLLFAGPTSRLQPILISTIPTNKFSQNNEFKPGYLGVVFSCLSLYTLFYLVKYRKKNAIDLIALSSIAFAGLILSLGPFLHLFRQTIHKPFPIPLPYLFFYYVAPGFQGFRNSARWETLFVLAFAVAICIILSKITKRYSSFPKIIIYLTLIAGTVLEFNFPLQTNKVPQVKDFPKVYSWLNTTPKETAIIELPIYNWGSWPYTQEELWREYYGTLHFRKTVNGYTGFSPPPWQNLINTINDDFPSKKSIQLIQKLGVTYLIVDKDLYDKEYNNKLIKISGSNIIELLRKDSSLHLVQEFDNQYVFSFIKN